MEFFPEQILSLSDEMAIEILKSFAKAQLRRHQFQPEIHRSMIEAAAIALGVKEPPLSMPGEGDVARQALQLLVQDSKFKDAIISMVEANSKGEKFLGVAETITLVTAALVVLQSHVQFERGKDGRWTVKVEKKPTSNELLKPLVQKLLALVGSGTLGPP